jgi:hypothetical protein
MMFKSPRHLTDVEAFHHRESCLCESCQYLFGGRQDMSTVVSVDDILIYYDRGIRKEVEGRDILRKRAGRILEQAIQHCLRELPHKYKTYSEAYDDVMATMNRTQPRLMRDYAGLR